MGRKKMYEERWLVALPAGYTKLIDEVIAKEWGDIDRTEGARRIFTNLLVRQGKSKEVDLILGKTLVNGLAELRKKAHAVRAG
jgi:hypothetical protein